MKKVNIMIFGTGEGAKRGLEYIDLQKVNIVAYVDNDQNKQGKFVDGVIVISPSEMNQYDYDFIVIGSISYYQEIYRQLREMNVHPSKIVNIFRGKARSFKQFLKATQENNHKYLKIVKEEHLSHFFQDYGICSMSLDIQHRNKWLYQWPDYLLEGLDYVRVSTLELMAREINEKNKDGAVAELGVYKGNFSKIIRQLFPDRKLYLFDTFEGFNEQDVKLELEKGFSKSKSGHLGDTSVEAVLRNIGSSENCIVRKGYFPETALGLEDEKFVFVSIDVDLYKPMLEGLRFFYPRLVKGGFILVHDYNHKYYAGVKEAVRTFSEESGVSFVPMSDYFGSAVFIK